MISFSALIRIVDRWTEEEEDSTEKSAMYLPNIITSGNQYATHISSLLILITLKRVKSRFPITIR